MKTDKGKNTKKPRLKKAELPPAADVAPLFPIVGIGASAGGLAAFEAFFSGMPANADPEMAFVLVQHLAPHHKSILADLIRRYTRMQVFEVVDGMLVQPNCTYIIPPNTDLALLNGRLQLLEPSTARGQRQPIDFFFRSLASDQHERAIGIVLSGTGSDGTLGARAIKGEGGMIMAQSRISTEFDGMPSSVIAGGLADYIMAPAEMPAQLIAYAARSAGKPAVAVELPKYESMLRKIFIVLRAQKGHDFSLYKPNTIQRRIERRMAVQQIEDLDDYVKYLQRTPPEVDALFGDLLIGVTNFFRDPVAFKSLEEKVVAQIFENKSLNMPIRVWVPGCSTGEEAYSIAILLTEYMAAANLNFTIQVFATDIDSRSVAIARAGIYPASIAADVSPERLARFFSLEPGGVTYRIHKDIRDLLIFSEQDLIKDPPFSKLDLISCRNVLIYMGQELQKKIIPLFCYALNRGGFLFLGTSESVGEYGDLFGTLDSKAKLYRRNDDSAAALPGSLGRFLPPMVGIEMPRSNNVKVFPVKPTLRELTERALLEQVAPTGVLVNGSGDIFYLYGRAGMYLEPAQGEAGINNVLKMAREGLRRNLALALRKATLTIDPVIVTNVHVKTNGHFVSIKLTVRQLRVDSFAPGGGLYLVVFEEEAPSKLEQAPPALDFQSTGGAVDNLVDAEARITVLQNELKAKAEYIQSTQEELESSNEELKSSNEEMQSVNEELQSTNEELETAKEEMQSVNEELATVNAELQTKLIDLSRSNNDMNNLLAGTGIGTVFLDHRLRILRFTPAAAEIIKLIPSDIGRPVSDIASTMVGYDGMVADTHMVLNTLVPKELEVLSLEGKWYAMRIQAYRTIDNVIEGAVITFIDITNIVDTRESLRRLALVVRDAHDAIIVQDLAGRTLSWSPSAVRMYGWTEAEALSLNVSDRIPHELQGEALLKLEQLGQADVLQSYCTRRITKGGIVLQVWITATVLVSETGQAYAIATTEREERGEGAKR